MLRLASTYFLVKRVNRRAFCRDIMKAVGRHNAFILNQKQFPQRKTYALVGMQTLANFWLGKVGKRSTAPLQRSASTIVVFKLDRAQS